MEDHGVPGREAYLTSQEMNVLNLIAEVKTNKEIACALNISPATVKRHMENILRKLQLVNRVEAAVYAVRTANHLVESKKHSRPPTFPNGPSGL